MLPQPRVTVFIPVHNRAALIGGAIRSVLSQSFTDFELLVIDDGSSDDTVAAVLGFRDPRLRLVRNERNLGIPLTRQRGLELARGDYLALLDSDDAMSAGRLQRQVDFLDRNPAVASLGGWLRKADKRGRKGKTVIRPRSPAEVKVWLLFRNAHANTTLMGRTAIMRSYCYRADFHLSQDYDLAARMARDHDLANLPHVLTDMLVHEEQATSRHQGQKADFKIAIMREQIERLGIEPTRAELEKHYLLSRVKAADVRADPELPAWAGQWLKRLLDANLQARIFDQAAMTRVFAMVAAQTVRRASPVIGFAKALSALGGLATARTAAGMTLSMRLGRRHR